MNALLILLKLLVVLVPESFYMINSYKEQGILEVGKKMSEVFVIHINLMSYPVLTYSAV